MARGRTVIVRLPEIEPAQVDAIFNFVGWLQDALFNAYEHELVEIATREAEWDLSRPDEDDESTCVASAFRPDSEEP